MSDPWEVDNVGLLDYDSSKRRYTMNTKFTLTIQDTGGTSQTIELEADFAIFGPNRAGALTRVSLASKRSGPNTWPAI